MNKETQRGFALIVAIVLISVILAVGEALLDVAYKQIILSSSAKNSQYAFYNADSALECALFYDQQKGAFYYGEANDIDILCNGVPVTKYSERQDSNKRVTTFDVPCVGTTGTCAHIEVFKLPSGTTDIYADGYSTGNDTVPTRVERGLKAHY